MNWRNTKEEERKVDYMIQGSEMEPKGERMTKEDVINILNNLVSDIEEYMDAFPVYYDGDTVYNRELQEACEHILELIGERMKEVEK